MTAAHPAHQAVQAAQLHLIEQIKSDAPIDLVLAQERALKTLRASHGQQPMVFALSQRYQLLIKPHRSAGLAPNAQQVPA